MRDIFDDYLACQGAKAYQDRLEEASRRRPTGLREAYFTIQRNLPKHDWSLYSLPFTVGELPDGSREDPTPSFFDLAGSGLADIVSAWNQPMDAIETMSENTIIQSADGEYVALYFKAGLNSVEAGEPVAGYYHYQINSN